ncbi:MAG: 3-hydroxyacyl-CoA dehydrogenase NAD-binding domain-containing protein [Myxococcaceae bacterium]
MNMRIRRAAVLGAGVMGSGIAAQLANAGIPVVLLDVSDALAKSGREGLRKQKPAPIYSTAALALIDIGSFDQNLSKIAQCDWVVEVVKEDLAIKQALFARVEQHLAPNAIVSSNTSGLSVNGMLEGRSLSFRQRFLVTHFFNPVRYMKLLELVAGPDTRPEVMATFARFGEEVLGKGIVYAKDTTNFIANRIGVFAIMRVLHQMKAAGLSVEEVDKIFGPAMGRPKSAIFRTADLVGLDTLVHVAKNCFDTLSADESRATFEAPAFLHNMVKERLIGEKAGQGFYKKGQSASGEKEILVLDVDTLQYRTQKKVRFDSLGAAREVSDVRQRMATVLSGTDAAAKFAERITLEVLAYASRRIPEIADDIVNVDRAMRWGFGWELGPFESWDALGVDKTLERMKALQIAPAPWVEAMCASGRKTFYAQDGKADNYWDIPKRAVKRVPEHAHRLSVEQLRRESKPLEHNDSASLWDAGDSVLLLEFHSKMNSIDQDIVTLMHKALDTAEQRDSGLLLANDGENFSAGANIMALLMAAKSEDFDSIRALAKGFQDANQRMRYSAVPVVSAPFGLTLGGGAEAAMGANALQAHAELYMGLVEVGVGLIPGGGGTLMLLRNVFGPHAQEFDALPFLRKVFLTIGTAKVSTSAEEARELGYLTHADGITLNRDLLLADAKQRVLGMLRSGFRPPRRTLFRLPGKSGQATMDMVLYDMEQNHQISAHDRKIGRKLAGVLSGGDTSPGALVSEERILELELEAFLSLCGEEKSQERLAHMLTEGKPLRN